MPWLERPGATEAERRRKGGEERRWIEFRGDRNYLRALWDDCAKCRRAQDNFHHARRTTLFFARLSTTRARAM